ncbi:MAG: aldolase [Anaerolineae bacterium]|nr:aldolase [Anaerolineae bacterium]
MVDPTLYQQIRAIGRDLYVAGMTSSHGGNVSVRQGDRLLIKRRGAMLGRLQPADLVQTGLFDDDQNTPDCSSELIVHRAIYRATSALAVVHAHPRTAVALSFSRDVIVPVDSEGAYILGPVPVVAVERPSGSPELAQAVAAALCERPVVVVRSHGSFASGETLEQAFQRTSVLEEACEIIWKSELWARVITNRDV